MLPPVLHALGNTVEGEGSSMFESVGVRVVPWLKGMANRARHRECVRVWPLPVMLPDVVGHGDLVTAAIGVVEEQDRGVAANVGSIQEGGDAGVYTHPCDDHHVGIGDHPNSNEMADDFGGPKGEHVCEPKTWGNVR